MHLVGHQLDRAKYSRKLQCQRIRDEAESQAPPVKSGRSQWIDATLAWSLLVTKNAAAFRDMPVPNHWSLADFRGVIGIGECFGDFAKPRSEPAPTMTWVRLRFQSQSHRAKSGKS